MLRKKSRNHTDPSKRQSMFLETVSHSLGMHQSRNRSSEYISDPVLIGTTSSRIPVRLTKREPAAASAASASIRTRPSVRTTHSSRSAAALKRSSMALDGDMIRDYNIAMRGMDPAAQNTTRSDSDSSITSSDSTASSLFSNGNSVNLRDLLYEELDDESSRKSVAGNLDTATQFPLHSTKALFMVKDNMHEQGTWLGVDDTLGSFYPNSDEHAPYSRTALEFI